MLLSSIISYTVVSIGIGFYFELVFRYIPRFVSDIQLPLFIIILIMLRSLVLIVNHVIFVNIFTPIFTQSHQKQLIYEISMDFTVSINNLGCFSPTILPHVHIIVSHNFIFSK